MDDDQWTDGCASHFDINKIAMEYFDEDVQETDFNKGNTPTSFPYEHNSQSSILAQKESSYTVSAPRLNTESSLQNINFSADGSVYEVLATSDAMVETNESLQHTIYSEIVAGNNGSLTEKGTETEQLHYNVEGYDSLCSGVNNLTDKTTNLTIDSYESSNTADNLLTMVDQYVLENQNAIATDVQHLPPLTTIDGSANKDSTAPRMVGNAFTDPLVLVPLSVINLMSRTNMSDGERSCLGSSYNQLNTDFVQLSKEEFGSFSYTTNGIEQRTKPSSQNQANNPMYTSCIDLKDDSPQETSIEAMKPKNLKNKKALQKDYKKYRSTLKTCVSSKAKDLSELQKPDHTKKQFTNDFNSSKKCKVCGDKESKHVHYGGRSCQSCRAFFRRYVKTLTRRPDFVLNCSCAERCFEKSRLICKITPSTRKSCKYCRYKRCQKNAGMVKNWVLSAYKLTVEKENTFPKEETNANISQGKEEKKISFKYSSSQEENSINDLIQRLNQACLADLEIIDKVKRGLKTMGKNISIRTRSSLDIMLSHQIHQMAMSLDEFVHLESLNRVSLFQSSAATLKKLAFLRFICEHLLSEITECSSDVLIKWYHILYMDGRNYKRSSSDVHSFQNKTDRILKKMYKLVKGDNNIFSFLFPIVLFSSNENTSEQNTRVRMQGLKFLEMLQKYFLRQTDGNHGVAAVKLGIANELASDIRDL